MIYSIGHSNIEVEKFISILLFFNIQILFDCRGIPYSKYAPQFNIDNLKLFCKKNNIEYIHKPSLNGIDTNKNSSPTTSMQQDLKNIIDKSKSSILGLMGANNKYKECHRYKLCNWICKLDNSINIEHIALESTKTQKHITFEEQIDLFS